VLLYNRRDALKERVSEQGTVLVVDDEVGSRESLRAILKPDYQF
jgi:hypothetical protein